MADATVDAVLEFLVAPDRLDELVAVDANGAAVPTRYEIDGTTLTQVVETDARTAYPVVADPSCWWWVWTGTACAANLATSIVAATKLADFATELAGPAKGSAALSSAIDKIGGAQNVARMDLRPGAGGGLRGTS